jgi:hypothetical protein
VSAQTGYHLKLTGPGLSLDKEVPEELANRITLLVLSGGKSDHQPTGERVVRGPRLLQRQLEANPSASICSQVRRQKSHSR